MPDLKQMITNSAAHSRKIDMRTYPISKDTVIVEGELRDDCYQPVFDLTGDELPAGPIHHLMVRLLIRIDSKEIIDAQAEMLHVPHNECQETLDSIKKVIGLKVEGGFIKKVLLRIGGVNGCSHMTHLLTVMSQEVFQGIVVVGRSEKKTLPKSIDEIRGLENLMGSCKMWDQDGIKLRNINTAIKSNRNHH